MKKGEEEEKGACKPIEACKGAPDSQKIFENQCYFEIYLIGPELNILSLNIVSL